MANEIEFRGAQILVGGSHGPEFRKEALDRMFLYELGVPPTDLPRREPGTQDSEDEPLSFYSVDYIGLSRPWIRSAEVSESLADHLGNLLWPTPWPKIEEAFATVFVKSAQIGVDGRWRKACPSGDFLA